MTILSTGFYIITDITVPRPLFHRCLMGLMIGYHILFITTTGYCAHTTANITAGFARALSTPLYLLLNKGPSHCPTSFCHLRRAGICQNIFCILWRMLLHKIHKLL